MSETEASPGLARSFRAAVSRRPRLANAFLAGFGCVAALVTGEIVLRLLPIPDIRHLSTFTNPPLDTWADPRWANPGGRAYRRHPVVGYEHAPDVTMTIALAGHARGEFVFRTNNLGLRRDVATAVAKRSGTFRILVLGDSQTDGYVDNHETFASVLESTLRGRVGEHGVDVLNAGVVGYSPAQEYLWYRHRGAALAPDLVILVFYVGNDVVELRDPSKPTLDPATGEAIAPREGGAPDEPAGPGRFEGDSFLDRSRMVALGRYTVRVGPLAGLWRRFGLPGALDEIGGFSIDTLIEVLRTCHGCFWQSQHQAVYARRDLPGMQRQLEAAGKMMVLLSREVAAAGSTFSVALLPSRMQVEPALAGPEAARTAHLLGLGPTDLAVDGDVSRAVLDQLAAAGIPAIPLEDPLRAAAQQGQIYYSRDWHMTVLGHRAVGQALAERLWSDDRFLPRTVGRRSVAPADR